MRPADRGCSLFCSLQRAADLEALLAGRRLESAEASLELEEQHRATVQDRLRQELQGQDGEEQAADESDGTGR